jgi:hypothetical protein
METIDKVELIKDHPNYLKYHFSDSDILILPRAIYELISVRDVLITEVKPVVEAEQLKDKPSANILNLVTNLDLCISPQLDILINQIVSWQNATIALYELTQKIEQTQSFNLCKERDNIISYDVINKTFFPF